MASIRPWVPVRIGICLAVLIIAAPVVAQQMAAGALYYRYFDERIELACDTSEVAIFERPAAVMTPADVARCAKAAGIAEGAITVSGVPSMWKAQLPDSARSDEGVRSVVAALAGDENIGLASPVFRTGTDDPVIVTPFLHVGFGPSVGAKEAEAVLADAGAGTIVERNWSNMPGVYRIQCESRNGFEVLELANSIAELPGVHFAEPDMIFAARKSLIPDDTFFNIQWGLHNTGQSGGTVDMDMDCPEAWDITTGDADVIVVILDDGTQQNHPDINQIPGADFTGSGTGGGPLNQCDNHGTAVAGCTSAIINNGLGVAGVAPDCKVAAAKWSISNLGTPCPGTGSFAISWFVNALGWAETIGARVTNNSNGFGPSSTITNKYLTTRNAGIVHFAATGNDGTSVIGYPASLPTVNAVGAINRFGNKASFSTYGTGIAFVAPGQEIATTDRTGSAGYVSGDYVSVNGTSFSSPYAAGVAALVVSADDTLVPDDIEQIMNDTAMDRGAAGYDLLYGWGILNANDALLATVPNTLTLSGLCFYDVGMTLPVDPLTVTVTNLASGTTYAAGTTANQYTLDLTLGADASAGDTLRYIAKDDTEFINVTDHVITSQEAAAGAIAMDLVLDEFYLDLVDFPQYEADGPDFNEYTGAAVAQMVLNYIWWNSILDPTPPLLFADQTFLYDYGIAANATPGLDFIDPVGMRATIQDHRPTPYSQFGYNFSIRHDTDSTEILKQIAQWVAYEIGTYGGLEPGHPLHVPGAIPAYGDYSNWMAVRGIHTSEDAYPLPDPLDVYGFWINDPLPATLGGIGENSYKTAGELLATYYFPLTTGDAYDGEYVAICEPPDDVTDQILELKPSPERFGEDAVAAITELRRLNDDTPADVLSAANAWVVAAAIEGVSEQLIPYDAAFARRFRSTTAGKPLLVVSENGDDYFAVPFNTAGVVSSLNDSSAGGTAVVILVSADDGCFKEASWVAKPVTYLPVFRDRALSITKEVFMKYGIDPRGAIDAGLVHLGSTPYYPHWRTTDGVYVVTIGQDGSASLSKATR